MTRDQAREAWLARRARQEMEDDVRLWYAALAAGWKPPPAEEQSPEDRTWRIAARAWLATPAGGR